MYNKSRIAPVLGLFIALACLLPTPALAGEVVYNDNDRKDLNDASVAYIIRGNGPGENNLHKSGNYFYVPEGTSSEDNPLTVILENVNRSQDGCNPQHSFIDICNNNYVIVKLRGTNYIKSGEQSEAGPNDGMSAISVRENATLKVTSDAGDGSTDGSLEAYGGGGKYGGAAIGRDYYYQSGNIIIAGGTINATGGHCAAGIGTGREGECKSITITGGDVTAQGGEYAAGIGSGDNVSGGDGGDLWDLTITGGTIHATGGANGAGIGCSEGGVLHGTILISGGDVTAKGGYDGAGIGCGDGGSFKDDEEKGVVKITGGTINATGGENGAGIGGGNGSDYMDIQIDQAEGADLSITAQGGANAAGIGSGDEDCDDVSVKLRGGYVYAKGGSGGAGIGGGDDAKRVYISGTGKIDAYGGSNAAAIGAGYDAEVNDWITIEGDSNGHGDRGLTITADSGGGTSAGIGSGSEDCGSITIKNATIKAWGDNSAADIGTGGNWGNGGVIDSVDIENCRIDTKGHSKSGAGIGAGHGCECKKITIRDSECYGNSIGEGMGVYFKFWANYGDMDSITIENSTIQATWDAASGSDSLKGSSAAGIGSCTLGCVHAISIKNSNVTAKGIHGGAGIGSGGWGADNFLGFEYIGGEVGSITIENSTVNATGAEPGTQSNSGGPGPDLTHRPIIGGGAGIGGGGNTSCGTITIDNSTVTAKAGKYAAGIGGGGSESVDSVAISSDSVVTATGGEYGAGIGSGGSTNATTATVFHADVDTITIDDSAVTAQGGKNAAGIGAGCGAAMDTTDADGNDIAYNIEVHDSTVNATGGEGGAGIGGGTVGAYSRGGHSGDILLEGSSHITATGGKQGAGVGGGAASDFQNHGGCDNVVIDLAPVDDATPKGPDALGSYGGWLVATGGKGAAGIGAGGYLFHKGKNDPIPNTNDTQSVEIKSGYVKATGGPDDTDDAGYNTGSGAGIGGGAAGTRLKNLTISGGWVEAYAGDANAAAIGHGGNAKGGGAGTDDSSNLFTVSAGTVVADTMGAGATKVFDGGSITTKVSDAHNSAGTAVYQTTMKTISDPLELVEVHPQYAYYGIRPIYNDAGSKVYLYLPVSSENAQTADQYIPGWMDHMHYYGTTTTNNDGWLKMDGEGIPFKDPDDVRYGDEFTLKLDDEDVAEGTQWQDVQVTGAAELVEVEQATSPGMKVKLKAKSVGEFSVSAVADGSSDPELYWCSKANYSGSVAKAIPTVEFTSDLSKVYDSQPVTDPGVTTNSPGAVSYAYSTQDGTAPKDAGDYTVTATAAETSLYESASKAQEFTIQKAPTYLGLELSQDGSTGTVTAIVAGLYEEDGSIVFTVNGGDPTEPVPVRASQVHVGGDGTDGKDVSIYTAELSGFDLPAEEYTVEATYTGNNYEGSEATATGTMERTTPQIHCMSAADETYANTAFNLNTEVRDGITNIDDLVKTSYEIVWDGYVSKLGYDPTITLNEGISGGSFSVKHVGKAMIKITAAPISGQENIYNTAVAYVPVNVAPAPLTITSYVREKGENLPEATVENFSDNISSVNVATYGNLDGLESVLNFGGLVKDRGDTPESFTHGHGTLSASPLAPTTEANESYVVSVIKNGPEVVTDEGTRTGAFFSRDYTITYDSKPLNIQKRTLAIQALDASGVYGGEEPNYDWDVASNQQDADCDGLAAWDSKDTVFSAEPTVTREGPEYATLNAGTYNKVLKVEGGESDNYEISGIPGNLTVTPVSLSDKDRFEVSVQGTVYNGSEQRQSVTVTDKALGKELELGEDKDFTVAYVGDTTNAGRVRAVVKGHGNYEGFQSASYLIAKARIAVRTESATKLYDGTPLTAGGAEEGIIGDDATFTVTGTQTDPGNTRNSYELAFASEQAAGNYRIAEDLGVLWVRSNDIARFELSQPDDVTYDGKEHAQPVTLEIKSDPDHRQPVTLDDGEFRTLVEGVDYTLAYAGSTGNLTDAGTITVTATGIGTFKGTTSVTYAITPAPLAVETDDATKVYDGTPLTAQGGTILGLMNGETATVKTTGSQTEVGSSKNTYEIVWDGTAKQANYEVTHEDLGTLWVTEDEPTPEVAYVCTQGAGGSWTRGSSASLMFVYKRSQDEQTTFEHFTGVTVDGKALPATAYDAKSGSVVLSLKPSYLQGLSASTHTLEPQFDDGAAQKVSFTIVDANGGGTNNSNGQNNGTTNAAGTVVSRTTLPYTADASLCALPLALVGIAALVLRRTTS